MKIRDCFKKNKLLRGAVVVFAIVAFFIVWYFSVTFAINHVVPVKDTAYRVESEAGAM